MRVLLLLLITAAIVAKGAEGLTCKTGNEGAGQATCTSGQVCTTTYKDGAVTARGCGETTDKSDCDSKADCLDAGDCVCTCDTDDCNAKGTEYKKAPVGAVKAKEAPVGAANAKPNAAVK